MKKFTYVTVLLLLVAQFNFSQEKHSRIKINNPTQATMRMLAEKGIDLKCGAVHDRNSLTLELNDIEINSLKNINIPFRVEINDLTKFYSERAAREKSSTNYKSKASQQTDQSQFRASVSNIIQDNFIQYTGCDEINWVEPTNFHFGTMGNCLSVSEMLTELDEMYTYSQTNSLDIVSQKLDASPSGQKTWGNPSTTITNPQDNGPASYSGQGTTRWDPQTINYIRITGNQSSTAEGTRPQILFTSMIHSREVSALMNNIYFMWYLIENYNSNDAIKELVDNNELYFVPVVNPDGLRWNEHLNSGGGGMQRKNCRPNTGSTTNTTADRGVDLNRNFDYYWNYNNIGSSGTPSSGTYRGPSPASEPETQIMEDFILNRNFQTGVWNHSYANSVPHPYGGVPSLQSNREDEFYRWHEEMTRYNRYLYGATIFYESNGLPDDWMLGGLADNNGSTGSGQAILATTPEHGSTGFWPNNANVTLNAERSMRISLATAYYGGKYAKLHDLTQSNLSGTTADLDFGIERIGQTGSDFTVTVTAISLNITGVTQAGTETGMSALEQRTVTAQLQLSGGILANEKIEYNVKLSNDNGIIYEVDFEKYYQPTLLFDHDPDTDGLTGWTQSGGWNNTSADAYSLNDALSTGTYSNNATKTLTTTNSFDLSSSDKVIVQFYTKWDLERNYDFVEVLGSTNGTNWTALCANYTKPNATSNTTSHDNKGGTSNFQANSDGQVYDGDRMDNWVMDEIAIDASNNSFLNGTTTAQFRFNFRTDASNVSENYSTTSDGFFLDDFKVISVQIPCDNSSSPTGLTVDSVTTSSASIIWDNVPSATYDLRYRIVGAPTWTEITDIATNSYNITGLTFNDYEVQISTRCVSSTSSYSLSQNFTISSCVGGVVSSFPYTESFESGLGDWTQGINATDDDIDWTSLSGGTPSTGTGPSSANDGSQYLYTEASTNVTPEGSPGKSAFLNSPCFNLNGQQDAQISFGYHMYGDNLGTLSLEVSTNDGAFYSNLITLNPASQNLWKTQVVDLTAYVGQYIKLRFHAITGADYSSDIAIDNIIFSANPPLPAPPTAVCKDITVQLDATGSVTILPSDVDGGSSGDGSITLSLDIDTFTCSNIGPNIVTLTVTDPANPPATTCTATVTVTDKPLPKVTTLPDLTDPCYIEVTAIPEATDCDGDIMGLTGSPLTYNQEGTYTILWQYIDSNGNIVDQNQTVIIDEDTTDPVPDLGSLPDINSQCEINSLTPPTATDNCALTVTVSSNAVFPITSNVTITWTYDDGNENTVTQDQNINILGDTTDPTASNPTAANVQCSADIPPVDILDVTDEADNCSLEANITVAHVSDVSDGNSNPEVITRTYSVTDEASNAINVTQTITVNDTTDPTASNPTGIAAQCTAPAADISVVTDEADKNSNSSFCKRQCNGRFKPRSGHQNL